MLPLTTFDPFKPVSSTECRQNCRFCREFGSSLVLRATGHMRRELADTGALPRIRSSFNGNSVPLTDGQPVRISAASFARYRAEQRPPGAQLAPPSAWAVLALASGDAAFRAHVAGRLSDPDRSRARTRLAERGFPTLVPRLHDRGGREASRPGRPSAWSTCSPTSGWCWPGRAPHARMAGRCPTATGRSTCTWPRTSSSTLLWRASRSIVLRTAAAT